MYLIAVLYLFLPAGFANMAPPIAARLFPKFDLPLDLGRSFRRHRIFGDHKTFRGILAGVIVGFLCFYLQRYLYYSSNFFSQLSLIDYSSFSPSFAVSIAFGSLAGDAAKSFFKRQVAIAPGRPWFPWDQIDWIIGSSAFASPFITITPVLAGSFLTIGLIAHLLSKVIGFFLHINDSAI